jgi:tetratricopeptide (TPR) repeat protein
MQKGSWMLGFVRIARFNGFFHGRKVKQGQLTAHESMYRCEIGKGTSMTAQPVKTIILDLLHQGHLAEVTFVRELNETERTAIGTPERWSAKDHLAHMTFCLHQNLIGKVTALLQQQVVPPREESVEQMNARVFAQHQLRPWSEIHAVFEHVYAELIQLAERLSEADLMDYHRFSALTEGRPLYVAFLGNGYEHLQEHLMQYYSDRNDLSRAMQLREQCTNRVIKTEVPAWVKGWFLYKLASFYAHQQQPEQAAARLQEALTLAPDLITEWLQNNPILAAVRDHSA